MVNHWWSTQISQTLLCFYLTHLKFLVYPTKSKSLNEALDIIRQIFRSYMMSDLLYGYRSHYYKVKENVFSTNLCNFAQSSLTVKAIHNLTTYQNIIFRLTEKIHVHQNNLIYLKRCNLGSPSQCSL